MSRALILLPFLSAALSLSHAQEPLRAANERAESMTKDSVAAAAGEADKPVPSVMDFHSHSYCSDGNKTPETLAQEAKAAGLRYWGLSDHDTTACVARAGRAARKLGIRYLQGVEMSAEDDSVHVVAIGVDIGSPALKALLESQKTTRLDRLHAILTALGKAGVPLDAKDDVLLPKYEEELRLDGEPALSAEKRASITEDELIGRLLKGQVTRPDIAGAMIRKGYVKEKKEAFDKYLANGGPGDVPMLAKSFREVIAAVHAAGGKAVLAHPYTIEGFAPNKRKYPFAFESDKDAKYASLAAVLDAMLKAGLDGFETRKPGGERGDPRVDAVVAAAGRELLLTPGSDYHGGVTAGIGPKTIGGMLMRPSETAKLLKQLGLD
jgi:predicted metal-dependent phosphoesterase TrpH